MRKTFWISSLAIALSSSTVIAGTTNDFAECDGRSSQWAPPFHTDENFVKYGISVSPTGLRDGCWDDFHLTARSPIVPIFPCDDPGGPDCPKPAREKDLLPERYWDEGWGLSDDPASDAFVHLNSAYCVLNESFSLLERVAHRAQNDPRHANLIVLQQAYDYVKAHTTGYRPKCFEDGEGSRSAQSGAPEFMEGLGRDDTILLENFFERTAVARAATLLHEAWHRGTGRTHEIIKRRPPDMSDAIRVDRRYQDFRGESDSLEDQGVSTYSIHAQFFEEYSKLENDVAFADAEGERASIDDRQRVTAISRANRILRTRFSIPTSRRVSYFNERTILAAMARGDTSLALPFWEGGISVREDTQVDEAEAILLALPDEVCGLTAIQGAFKERDDFVRIIRREIGDEEPAIEAQLLVGNTAQSKDRKLVGARARCFPGAELVFTGTLIVDGDTFTSTQNGNSSSEQPLSVTGEKYDLEEPLIHASTGEQLIPSTSSCFLTGVGGRLQAQRENVGTRISSSNGGWTWHIEGNTKESNRFQRIDVACINRKTSETLHHEDNIVSNSLLVEERALQSGPNAALGQSFERLGLRGEVDIQEFERVFDSATHSCALASISGRLFDERDSIDIFEQDQSNTRNRTFLCDSTLLDKAGAPECTTWKLDVKGDHHLLNDYEPDATASCFEY